MSGWLNDRFICTLSMHLVLPMQILLVLDCEKVRLHFIESTKEIQVLQQTSL